MFRRFNFRWIFFVQIAHFNDFGMTVERVCIKIHFRIQSHHAVVTRGNQWIDFRQIGIGLDKGLVQFLDGRACLHYVFGGHAHARCQRVALSIAHACDGIDE